MIGEFSFDMPGFASITSGVVSIGFIICSTCIGSIFFSTLMMIGLVFSF
jgi:hypothetical protein